MREDLRNSSWQSAQYVVLLGVSLLTLKLNIDHFGRSVFDLWLVLASVWGVGGVLDFGFGVSIVRFVARSTGGDASVPLDSILATGLAVFVTLGLVIVGFAVAGTEAIYFSDVRLIPPSALAMARRVFLILGCAFYFQYLGIFFRSIMEGLQQFVVTAKVGMAGSFLMLIGVAGITVRDLSLEWLAVLTAVAAAMQCISLVVFVKRRLPDLPFTVTRFRWHTFRRLFGFSLAIQGATFLGALLDPLIKYLLRTFAAGGMVSAYEIARRFSLAISGLFANAFKNYLPKVSMLRGQRALQEDLLGDGKRLAITGIKYSALAFGIVSIAVEGFIVWFYKVPESMPLFFLLAFGESINCVGYGYYLFLIGVGKPALLVVVQCINLVFTALLLGIGLVLSGDVSGLIGYGIAILVGNVIMQRVVARVSGLLVRQLWAMRYYLQFGVFLVLLLVHAALLRFEPRQFLLWETGFVVTVLFLFRRDLLTVGQMVKSRMLGV
jgi:O-antigen/teichoic acid export membrane protein